MSFSWFEDARGQTLYYDSSRIVTLLPFVALDAESDVRCRDEVVQVEDGVFRWTRHFRLDRGASSQAVRLTMDAVAAYHASYLLIPAISYNGNRWGTGHEPRGFVVDGVPRSFAWHRGSIPGATYSEGERWSIALFGTPPAPGRGLSCALVPEAEQTTHRLIWQEEEYPNVYSDRDEYGPGYVSPLLLEPGAECVAVAYLVVAPVETARTAWRTMLDVAWRLNYHDTAPWFAPEEVWKFGIRFARESLWAEEGVFRGFSIGLLWEWGEEGARGSWQQRRDHKYEIGWAGQNASLAVALLEEYLRTGDDDSRARGLTALDCWVAHATLLNGLVRCHFDPILGEAAFAGYVSAATDGGSLERQDACNLGGAAQALFEAERLAERCGTSRPEYADVALGICNFVVGAQRADGNLGRAWTNDGTLLDGEGTIGAFLIFPLITAYKRTGDERYLQAAERGYAYYMAALLRDGYTTAGALDTDCIDKESAVPLLDAALALYELTGTSHYLSEAQHAAYYLASWQWSHTVVYPAQSALGAMGYDTFGGTSVSTQHHHLDPYAIACVPGWLRLAQLTGEDIWRQRAQAAWAHGTIGISDGRLIVLGKQRPAGSQDEGVFQTRWRNYGSVSEWLVAWPTAFRLATLRRLPDWTVFAAIR